jgi:hypothetical protein
MYPEGFQAPAQIPTQDCRQPTSYMPSDEDITTLLFNQCSFGAGGRCEKDLRDFGGTTSISFGGAGIALGACHVYGCSHSQVTNAPGLSSTLH